VPPNQSIRESPVKQQQAKTDDVDALAVVAIPGILTSNLGLSIWRDGEA